MTTRALRKNVAMARPPALVLKDLRNRAGLTAKQCADHLVKALNKTDRKTGKPLTEGQPTVWFRYESTKPREQGDRKIPYKIVRAIMPLFVGRGHPPITEDELLAVSEVHDMESNRRIDRGANVAKVSVYEAVPTYPKSQDDVRPLTVKYRAERGVYMSEETLGKRSFGYGPIMEDAGYKQAQQLVHVADDHADPIYPEGTVLHTVHISAFEPDELKGRRVALSIGDRKTGMFEVCVGRIDKVVGNSFVIKSLQGEDLDGDILGVVIRSLRRE